MMDRSDIAVYKGYIDNQERKQIVVVESNLLLSPESCKMESEQLRSLNSPYTLDYYGILQKESKLAVFTCLLTDCVDSNGIFGCHSIKQIFNI